MPAQMIRHTILLLALAALPGFAAAAGSQAGDNGRQPIGADNDGPRQAIPNATTNDGTQYDYSRYYAAPSRYYDPVSGSWYYSAPPAYVAPPASYVAPPTYVAPPAYYVPPATTYYVPAPSYYVPAYRAPGYVPARDPDLEATLAYCETRPLADRPACRDAACAGRFCF
jgi:hypothetical protein